MSIDFWTPERIAYRMICVEGKTFSEAGRLLGVSKNTCIGKARRLCLKRRADAPPSDRQIDRFPPPGGCRWPFGDVGEPNFHFCGDHVASAGMPYCPTHMSKAIISGSARAAYEKALARAAAERGSFGGRRG